MKFAVVVPWYNPKQRDDFLTAWGIERSKSGSTVLPEYLFLQRDDLQVGCAQTKNAGIARALESGADYVVVLDDDCYPAPGPLGQNQGGYTLDDFAAAHIAALKPQKIRMVYPTTQPHPRGMPYRNWFIEKPVAASIGLWAKNPDFDAVTSLLIGADALATYYRQPFRDYFPFSGMNFCFSKEWADCAVLVDIPRFDDIWMGWIWEKVAFGKGYCFNTAGPMVTHARQSNVWKNLDAEVKYLKVNEDIWAAIHAAPAGLSATELRKMFFERPPAAIAPVGPEPANLHVV